jgi:hypothetical protein
MPQSIVIYPSENLVLHETIFVEGFRALVRLVAEDGRRAQEDCEDNCDSNLLIAAPRVS